MTLFGKQVSVVVILSFLVGVAQAVGGTWLGIANSWHTSSGPALAILIAGAVQITVTAAVHVWDTMPSNTVAPGTTPLNLPAPATGTGLPGGIPAATALAALGSLGTPPAPTTISGKPPTAPTTAAPTGA